MIKRRTSPPASRLDEVGANALSEPSMGELEKQYASRKAVSGTGSTTYPIAEPKLARRLVALPGDGAAGEGIAGDGIDIDDEDGGWTLANRTICSRCLDGTEPVALGGRR